MIRSKSSRKSNPEKSATSTNGQGLHEQIRERAYEFYEERSQNGVDGSALSDWIAAEFELGVCANGDQGVAVNGTETDGSGI